MKSSDLETLRAHSALALHDIDAASDEELRREVIEDGLNPEAISAEFASAMDDLVSEALRRRDGYAKASPSRIAHAINVSRRPPLARIRQLIEEALRADPKLATAFRQGTRQSDADLVSLYDDLVLMRKIQPDDDGD